MENVCNSTYQLEVPYWLYTSYLLRYQMTNVYGRHRPNDFDKHDSLLTNVKNVLTVYLHNTFLRNKVQTKMHFAVAPKAKRDITCYRLRKSLVRQ